MAKGLKTGGESIEVVSGVNCTLYAVYAGNTGTRNLYMFPGNADLSIPRGSTQIATLPQIYRPSSDREFMLTGRYIAGLDSAATIPRLLISTTGKVYMLNYNSGALAVNTPSNVFSYIL